MIVTKDLTKVFGKFTAVNCLNLKVEAGESYGFLGPNGAGKTTTLLMLLGIHRPTSGAVLIDNEPVKSDSFSLKRKIGVVAEYQTFYENMTAWEYVMFFAKLYQVSRAEKRANELFEHFRLTEWRNGLIGAFSTGMKKKMGFIRALVHSPELLILDEPVSGLDPFGIVQVRSLLMAEKERGTTIIISSHILSEVEQTADRVGIISRGRLILEDTTENIRSCVAEGNRINLKFANLSSQHLEKIAQLPFVINFKQDGNKISLLTRNDRDYAEEIGMFILENGLITLEMKRSETSLEEAFVTISERSIETLRVDQDAADGNLD